MFQYRFSGSELIDGKAGVRGGESRTFGQEFSGQFQCERSRSRSITAPFGVLLNCKEMNLRAQILQNLFMASPFSYLLCQCLASANAEKLSNVQCFRSKADE